MKRESYKDRVAVYEPCAVADLNRAVAVLHDGGVVAFPTETYYGLAVDPFNPLALNQLFALKQRDTAKPILTLVDDMESLSILVHEVPVVYLQLMEKFWPGPLTLIFPARINLPTLLTAGTATVGVRQSSHPFARQLLRAFGKPITATSANISGSGAAVDAREVRSQFGNRVDMIFDGGPTPGKTGSTIVGQERGELRLIREGIVPFGEILQAV